MPLDFPFTTSSSEFARSYNGDNRLATMFANESCYRSEMTNYYGSLKKRKSNALETKEGLAGSLYSASPLFVEKSESAGSSHRGGKTTVVEPVYKAPRRHHHQHHPRAVSAHFNGQGDARNYWELVEQTHARKAVIANLSEKVELLLRERLKRQNYEGSEARRPLDRASPRNVERIPDYTRSFSTAMAARKLSFVSEELTKSPRKVNQELGDFPRDKSNTKRTLLKETESPKSLLKKGKPVSLVQPTDEALLSEYQLLIRESLMVFPTTDDDVASSRVPGRKNKPKLGQIGVCCRYCRHLPANRRGGGSLYYPGSVTSVYQAAQNIGTNHLLKTCTEIPEHAREELQAAKTKQQLQPRRSGGNSYWIETIRHFGLEDRNDMVGVWIAKEP